MADARDYCKVQQQHTVATAVDRQARHWDGAVLEGAHQAWRVCDERVLVTCMHVSAILIRVSRSCSTVCCIT